MDTPPPERWRTPRSRWAGPCRATDARRSSRPGARSAAPRSTLPRTTPRRTPRRGPSSRSRTGRRTRAPRPRPRRDGSRRRGPVSRGETLEGLPSEQRELQREARIGVLQIGAGELGDAAQALAHRVAVEEEIARDAVETAVETQVRVECAHEVGVALAVGERSEDPIGELADVALGPTEHKAVRAEVVKERDANAIAMYALGPLVGPPPLTTKKASLFGRPSWKSALVIALAAASRTHTDRPKHGEGDVHDRDDAKRHVCSQATCGARPGQWR